MYFYSPNIGDEVSVEIMATEEMKNLVFFVHGRSNVLKSDNLEVQNSKSFNFSFKATKSMMPKSKLLVYYIRDDGEIISDHVEINFGFVLQNTVSFNAHFLSFFYGQSLTLSTDQHRIVSRSSQAW